MAESKKLTIRQKAVLQFIAECIDVTGYAPTAQEVAREFSISLRPAQRHIERLEVYGYIRKIPNTARGLIVLKNA